MVYFNDLNHHDTVFMDISGELHGTDHVAKYERTYVMRRILNNTKKYFVHP